MEKPKNNTLIPRANITKIVRAKPPLHFREDNEVQAAYGQVGWTPNRNTKSWYRDIYEFYQNNEV